MASQPTKYDYIIVGAGTAGCVLASRLHSALPNLSIALLEAGADETSNPLISDPRAAQTLHGTDLRWKYTSIPQPSLDGRSLPHFTGKLVGGSSAVNYTAWTRGHAADYDNWARIVGDKRWSYEGLLPCFRKSEHWHDDAQARSGQKHGLDGPIRTHSGDFGYPLRGPMREAFRSVGFEENADMNSGDPNGVSPLVLNWHGLERQQVAACYPLDGMEIITNKLVSKVLFDDAGRAIGVELDGDKTQLRARKEVIVSCGGIRTPQLLLLSGIGPKAELAKHHIPVQLDAPDVGKNYIDHHATCHFWKLKNPDHGLALGSPAFNNPNFANSLPMDWMVTGRAPDAELTKAISKDGENFQAGPRSDYELTPMYLTNGAVPSPWLPFDGNYVSSGVLGLSTTSRGSITLNSTNPADSPIIDPNAISTEHDRAVLRAGMRDLIDAMASPAMAPFIDPTEVPPPGLNPLTKSSSDEEFDEHIRALAYPWFHAAGTAAMGKVVDAECRVIGVKGLRVVDASIFPVPISAHLHAPVLGVAEQAASMIIAAAK